MILVNCQWKETGTTATPRTTVTSSAVSLTPFGRLAWSDLLTQVSQKLTFTLFCLSENVSHYNKKCWKCCGTSDQVNTRPFVKMILVNCLWNDTVTIACNCDLIWRLSTRNSIWLACLIWFIDSDQPWNRPRINLGGIEVGCSPFSCKRTDFRGEFWNSGVLSGEREMGGTLCKWDLPGLQWIILRVGFLGRTSRRGQSNVKSADEENITY